MNDVNLFDFETHAITHPGKVRKMNEDACISRDNIGLWAVADGMGGHHAGDVASTNVVTALNEVSPPTSLRSYVDDVENQLLKCNANLRAMSTNELNNRTIGSTVASLIIYQDFCAYLWAGDSRLYRLRRGALTQLGRDHSQVEELVVQGVIKREDAESHPDANIITRAIGADDNLVVDVNVDKVEIGDTYLLCSDGLSKHVGFKEIKALLLEGSSMDICSKLINITLERGATDNVTVTVIKVKPKE
ncbi:PP2C family protein-serine/threonine phosphatase [Pseudomonadota bacterium]